MSPRYRNDMIFAFAAIIVSLILLIAAHAADSKEGMSIAGFVLMLFIGWLLGRL